MKGLDVRCRAVVAHDHANAGVVAKVFHVPVGVEGEVSLVRLKKSRVIEVSTEVLAIKRPLNDTRSVAEDTDLHGPGDRDICRLELHERLRNGEVVVGAVTRVGDIPSSAGRSLGLIGLVVVDSGKTERLGGQTAAGNVASHPESSRAVTDIGLDDDVGSLANAQGDDLGVIGLHLYKVICNDCHGVSINGEALNTFGTRVDKTQAMSLALLEGKFGDTGVVSALRRISSSNCRAVKVALSVDEVVIGEYQAIAIDLKNFFNQVKVLLVIPIWKQSDKECEVWASRGPYPKA